MVNNILYDAKIDTENIGFCYENCYVRKVILKVIQTQKTAVIRKGIDIDMYNAPRIPKYLLVDQCRFTQVMMNFISNSVKFTEKGII